MSEETISIIICMPHVCVKRIKVRSSWYVASINNLFPSQKIIYIYQSQQLIPRHTFEFYEIKDNAQIIILKDNAPNDEISKWIENGPECQIIHDKMYLAMNKSIINEVERLKDLRMIRSEMSRKKSIRFFQSKENIDLTNYQKLVIPPSSLDGPCCHELPVKWDL